MKLTLLDLLYCLGIKEKLQRRENRFLETCTTCNVSLMFQVLSYKGVKSGTLCVLLCLPSGYNEMGLVRKIKTQMSQLRKDRTGIIGLF